MILNIDTKDPWQSFDRNILQLDSQKILDWRSGNLLMRNQVSPFGNSNCFASFENAVSCGLDVCKAIGTSIGILALLLPACVCIASNAVSMLWVTAVRCVLRVKFHMDCKWLHNLLCPPSSFSGLFSNTFLDSSPI